MRYLLVFVALFSCSHSKPAAELYDQLVVVGTNDFHGYLKPQIWENKEGTLVQGGASWFGGYANILQEKYGDALLLLDGGDIFQGTLESNAFQGKSVVDFYNLLPYRAAAVGNHEFDYGTSAKNYPDRLGALKERMAEAKFPFLAANIREKKTGKLWKEKNLFPSVIVTAKGYKVGLLGLTTTTTPAKTLPQNVKDLVFEDFLEPTVREVKALREKGAELIVIVAHEGGAEKGSPLYELLRALPEGTVDAVVAGHEHSAIFEKVNGVPMIQARTKGHYFGRIDLFVNRQTRKVEAGLTRIHEPTMICGNWLATERSCDSKRAQELIKMGRKIFPLRQAEYEGKAVAAEAKVDQVLALYFALTDKKKNEVLATTPRDFEWNPPLGTNEVGELFVNAFQDHFPMAKAVYQNGGGLRRKINKGKITFGDLYEVHPFDNYAVEVKMKGKQLKDLLRVGVSGANMLPVIGGIKAKFYLDDKDIYLRDVNGDGKKEKWERDRLAELVWEKSGKPVGDEEEFWLATNDYLASGGDKTGHVFDSIPPSGRRFSDLSSRDVVATYLWEGKAKQLPPPDKMRLVPANP